MFLLLISRLQPRAEQPDAIPLPMTRADIANFLNLSPETVSRAAAAIEQRGLVKFDGRHCARILDAGQLSKLAAAL
jgi:CRP/FNR family transcriptional regulator